MTKEELAAKLNGRGIGHEITDQEEKQAKGAELIVIFAASDDLMEIRGAINDEICTYGSGECLIKNGKLLPDLDNDEIDVLEKYGVLEAVYSERQSAIKIEAFWDRTPYACLITTKAEFAPFEIMEDGDLYCRGIVIST